jgi:hypothetical protein
MVLSPGHWRWPSVVFLLASLTLSSGCPAPPEKVVPVEGKVLLGGQPMSLGTVTFVPDKDKGNKATGTGTSPIDSAGSYKLNYGGRNGVPPGWYKVSISPMGMPKEMPAAGQPLPKPVSMSPKYQHADTSGVAFEVVENPESGRYDIKLVK